eukprot:jgi/Mesen1/5577/ME000281S04642
MSFNNLIGGKLNLKGKALDVRGGTKKKKKKTKSLYNEQALALQQALEAERAERGGEGPSDGQAAQEGREDEEGAREVGEDHRTPAERRYHEQLVKLESAKAAKSAVKSHRQRVEEFNKYLANLSEHYDIPKVGPG